MSNEQQGPKKISISTIMVWFEIKLIPLERQNLLVITKYLRKDHSEHNILHERSMREEREKETTEFRGRLHISIKRRSR